MSDTAKAMKQARGRAAAAILGLVALALVLSPDPPPDRLLAAAVDFLRERPALSSTLIQTAFALLVGAGAVVLVALVVAKILDMLGLARAGALIRGRRQTWLSTLAADAVLLALLSLARRGAGSFEGSRAAGTVAESTVAAGSAGAAAPAAPAAMAEAAARPVPSVPFPLIAAAGALLAGGALLAVLRLRKGGAPAAPIPLAPEAPTASDEGAKGRAIAASRRRLEAGADAREAVIACYAEMCGIFSGGDAEAGRPGSAAFLTAREFAALLRSEGIGEPEIASLTSVFEKARYSNDACGEPDRLSARMALEALERRYGRPRP